MMSSILKSTYDLHIHAGPDVISRKCDDREVAKRMSLAGMCGGSSSVISLKQPPEQL